MTPEQARFQIRFDWGVDGLSAVGVGADVVVWVDALVEAGVQPPSAPGGVRYLIGADLPSARAVARWVLDLQESTGERIVISLIAAGSTRPGGGYRFAVEDQLAAGAVIAELGRLGLDATSPEAAAAEAAFLGLGRATAHLLTASVTAHLPEFTAEPARGRIDAALTPDDVVVLSSRE
jgi:2-phosphosulfolactate phosphatase